MTEKKSRFFGGTAAIASVVLSLIGFSTATAQVPVYGAPAVAAPPQVIGYMPERRGWFRQRTTYRPILAAPPAAPITTYYAPAPVTTYYMPAPVAAPRPATTTYYMPAPATTTYRVPSYRAPTLAAPGVTTYYPPAAPVTRAYYPQATVPNTTVVAPPVTTYYPNIPATSLPTRQLPSGASVPRTLGMPIIGF
ncbi:MAG: hypothetical protein ACKVH8_24430 [Pirellulales bacterium]|jgi:hypothetical protein